ncbi:MAG TPA: IPT/TIG domain-containing protein, partial [Verrucomicrobiae bacterium]|nr:IPT/TIG domain-containing protein [Verrucomicrobiae bacterium]
MRRYACFAVTFAFILCPLIGRAQTTPAVTSGGILNAASLTADSSNIASPGGLVSIFGKNLASAPASASTSPLPLNLGGTVVQIGNVYAPLLFVSPGQINAQIPFEAAPGTQNLVVWVNGHASAPVSVVIQPAAPGIFTVSQSGVGTALATHADGSAVSAGAPAIPGETIQVSVTGLGLTLGTPGLPAVQSGDIGRGQPTLTVPTATIGSVNAPVVSASASQGLVGQFSVKLVVPTAGTGDQLLTISAGGNTTKAAVSLPIGSPSAAQGGGGAGGAGGTSAVPNGPVIFSGGILNAASLDPASNDTAAPGSLISIFGNNLATATASGGAAPLPLQIGGTSVLIGGVSAPLLLVSASQVNAQVPFEIQPGSKISVVVVVNGVSSNAEPLQIVPSAPGIFSTAGNGTGTADVFHSDNTPVTNSAPALPGEEVTIYCTGLGATLSTASLPAVKTGQPGQGQLTILSPTVTMGG